MSRFIARRLVLKIPCGRGMFPGSVDPDSGKTRFDRCVGCIRRGGRIAARV
jgi:hypothetical protein